MLVVRQRPKTRFFAWGFSLTLALASASCWLFSVSVQEAQRDIVRREEYARLLRSESVETEAQIRDKIVSSGNRVESQVFRLSGYVYPNKLNLENYDIPAMGRLSTAPSRVFDSEDTLIGIISKEGVFISLGDSQDLSKEFSKQLKASLENSKEETE